MRCDQCKHWNPDKEEVVGWEAAKAGFRRCLAIDARWDITNRVPRPERVWSEDNILTQQWLEDHINALRSARAYVQDGSEYVAELVTGPDFFCAKFEQQ